MERSIENIWTNGFIKEDQFLAPKLNNLYQKKSGLLLEKLKRTYRTDNKSILPLAGIFALIFGFTGHILLGIYVAVLLLGLYFLNNRNLAALEGIRVEASSYEFLVAYRKMFTHLQNFYTRLLGIGLPFAGLIGYYLYFRDSSMLHKLFQLDFLYVFLIIAGLALALSGIGVLAYRISTKILYGNLLKKLDEMIEDMGELRK